MESELGKGSTFTFTIPRYLGRDSEDSTSGATKASPDKPGSYQGCHRSSATEIIRAALARLPESSRRHESKARKGQAGEATLLGATRVSARVATLSHP